MKVLWEGFHRGVLVWTEAVPFYEKLIAEMLRAADRRRAD
jgi:hypothetical protein